MANYLNKANLQVDAQLVTFIETEALAGTGIGAERFWSGLAGLVDQFMPRNRELLAIRDKMQGQIDEWHHQHGPVSADPAGYQAFLKEIGYLVPEPGDFEIETSGLDPEISPAAAAYRPAGRLPAACRRPPPCPLPAALLHGGSRAPACARRGTARPR